MQKTNFPRSPWKTRYFLDTEFTSFDSCQLISVAIVGEDGQEFYAERSDFETSLCSDFVREIVLPQLGQFPDRSMPLDDLKRQLSAWLYSIPVRPKPVLCYDYEGDFTLLADLLGGPLPPGWKAENILMRRDARRLAAYFAEYSEHHALHDARANAHAFI
ncbi:hypothetical protein CUJ91_32225 (plasmid) [Paraburkholderia graminis]|uniref:3'-5' exoribonuclease n=1 Tax=Paraburkholderia graminis TaxID=60548 RepID=UPI000DEF799D|nr:3'-5' exoribonuclease [Paraburkholderia graminis]AXF12667.1 hypothetical protein CUJ91_32225 [Paraburkholderia graminis]